MGGLAKGPIGGKPAIENAQNPPSAVITVDQGQLGGWTPSLDSADDDSPDFRGGKKIIKEQQYLLQTECF